MKALQKRSVAIVVMVAAIIAAIGIGQLKKPDQPASTTIVGSYTYIYDDCGVISKKTMEHIDAMNASLFAQTGAQILVQVTDTPGDRTMEDYAIFLGNKYGVGDAQRDNGLVLVLALERKTLSGEIGDYWVEPGDGIYNYVDELDDMLRAYLEKDFAKGDYDEGLRKTFDAYIEWFEDLYNVTVKENYIPAVRENYTVGTNYYTQTTGYVEPVTGTLVRNLIILMVVLLIIWVIVDAFRWDSYRKRYMRPGMGRPTVTYYPVFWGRRRRRRVVTPPRPPRNPPKPPTGGGYRPSGGTRPSSTVRNGGRTGGSFGGGSFGNSRSSSGRSGSRSFGGGGSFGGRSGGMRSGGRSGGFSGGGRRGGR